MADPWLQDAILDGLQGLLVLALEGQPAREVISGTHDAWCEAVALNRDLRLQRDLPRLRLAFATLRATVRRWPSPREFTDILDRTVENRTARPGDRRDPEVERERGRHLGAIAAEGGWTRAEILAAGWIPPEETA